MSLAMELLTPLGADDEAANNETARRILDTALALYLEFGFRRTAMENVTRRIGLSRNTIHRHYGDKESLFQAVVLREARRSMKAIQHRLALVPNGEECFIEGFLLVLNGIRKHPLVARLLETEPEWLLPYLTLKSGSLFQLGVFYCENFLREQQAAGFFQTIPVAFTAEIMVRLTLSSVVVPGGLFTSSHEEELRQTAKQFLQLVKP